MSKRFIAVIISVFLLLFPVLAYAQTGESWPKEEDIISIRPLHFFVMYGDLAKAMIEKNHGANLVISAKGDKIALLLPEDKSPTGAQVVDHGMVTFVIIGGRSAAEMRKKWGGAVLRYSDKDKLLVFLQVPKELAI